MDSRKATAELRPADPLAALERIHDVLHLLPGVDRVDAMWLRGAIRAYLDGRAPGLDATLRLDGNVRRRLMAQRRHRALRGVAQALGGEPSMKLAGQLQAIVDGRHAPPAGMGQEVAALRADPHCPRSIARLWRVLSTSTDVSSPTLRQLPWGS